MRKAGMALLAALAAWSAASAFADQGDTAPNPLIAAIGPKPAIAAVEVIYPDGSIEAFLDRPSSRYIEAKLSPEKRQALDAMIQPRILTPETAAERFSEYLVDEDLRARLARTDAQGRSLNLTVTVEDLHFSGMVLSALTAMSRFPSIDASFALSDAQTGEMLASGKIRRCTSWAFHIDDAKRRHDLRYDWSGLDTDFRVMAGLTSALSGCVERLLTADSFPVGRAQIGTAYTGSPFFVSMPIRVSEPIYEIQIVAATEPATAAIESAQPEPSPPAPPAPLKSE